MTLSVRPLCSTLPTYSLTSDLLSFLRCGLQYRYAKQGNLRPPHSSQQWFAHFLRQVLEEAWSSFCQLPEKLPPWPEADTLQLLDDVNKRLESRGLHCSSPAGAACGLQRAKSALNELAPLLFPLLTHFPLHTKRARPPYYDLAAVIHGIAQIQLPDPQTNLNPLVQLIQNQLSSSIPDTVELIVDLKVAERPDNCNHSHLIDDPHCWQIQSSAYLRAPTAAAPTVAGLLVYLNELVPTRQQFIALRNALTQQPPQMLLPAPDSLDARILQSWRPRDPSETPPLLSLNFRLQRAVRIIPISTELQQHALLQLDRIAHSITTCKTREKETGQLISSWDRNSSHRPTCETCDARTWCPDYSHETQPRLPTTAHNVPN